MQIHYKTLFITLFASLLILVTGTFIWVSLQLDTTKVEEASDNILAMFHHELDQELSNALFLSVALSDNKALKEALLDEDEDAGYRILMRTLKKLKRYTYVRDIRMQILTSDMNIFARSWDNSYAGMPLEGFRVDLQRIRRLRKPKVSIDPGRLLTIKATTPFRDGVKIIGYIEAIKTFDRLTYRLRRQGIELTVLMDERFLDIATLMRENPTLGPYVVSNKNHNAALLEAVTPYADKIATNSYFKSEAYLHVVDMLRDSAGERIGYYLLSVPLAKMKEFENKEEKISFFLQLSKEDLYGIVERWESDRGSFKSLYDKELIKLLENASPGERSMFEEEARELLRSYTREELIDVIVKSRYRETKKGKIR